MEEGHMTQPTSAGRAWATGLTVFAAVIMMIAGLMQALEGIVALANSEFYVVGRKYTFQSTSPHGAGSICSSVSA
jgi:hypothetical protein